VKVFISWSGEMSRRVALALRGWLPDVLNEVEPWMSDEDIDKGAAGLTELATALSKCSFGIVCLTQENQHRDWVNFEAGALAKSVGDDPSRVATLLIDQAGPSEITGPLAQFQATRLNVDDMTKLVRSLNKVATAPRTEEAIDRAVKTWWSSLEQSIAEARKSVPDTTPAAPPRSDRELLEEILTLTRDLANTSAQQAVEQTREAAEQARAARTRERAVRQTVLSDELAYLESRIDLIVGRVRPDAYSVMFSRRGAHIEVSGITAEMASLLEGQLNELLPIPATLSVRSESDD
jgi:hypothetical protein